MVAIARAIAPTGGILRVLRPAAVCGSGFPRLLSTSPRLRRPPTVIGKPVDDIDVAFDYPSEEQGSYAHKAKHTPGSPAPAARVDKESSWPDNSILYTAVVTLGAVGLYMSIRDMRGTPAHLAHADRISDPGTDARRTTGHVHHTHPAHKPNNDPKEKWIGRGG
ncbi:hypothetical protein B0T26DRAFT_745126 [Lasiosphaeria miniovina]|uniref:Uncharacterized protein n=1 Tax=Lasiosphaeria miniovina TaxID=1954250 RepID=A0AA40BF18_9PEZI|nr:uncharacterized protein B0T26DRAFT_745126 [Lasiosphaeria miniovina]KAK0733032.1 hypothetical protein B0T26DRAFT_745126 [Lasiosphaeria miniovina]